jgi:hypothetical protein
MIFRRIELMVFDESSNRMVQLSITILMLLISTAVDKACGSGTVGILYEGWHGPAATAMNMVINKYHGTPLTIEQVTMIITHSYAMLCICIPSSKLQ